MQSMMATAEREEGPWFAVHQGYEVQIMDANDKCHRTGAIYSLAPSDTISNKPSGEWETMIITLSGNQIFVANALTGVGVGVSPIAMKEMYPVFPYYYQPPHITLIAAAAETGIFGALFYGLLLIAPWLLIFFRRKRIQMDPKFISITGALLAITVVGFFDYYTWMLQPGRYWQFLVWGVWASTYRRSMGAEIA